MVSLIRDGAHFTKKLFIGGATSADVERMREEAEAEALAKKKKEEENPLPNDTNTKTSGR